MSYCIPSECIDSLSTVTHFLLTVLPKAIIRSISRLFKLLDEFSFVSSTSAAEIKIQHCLCSFTPSHSIDLYSDRTQIDFLAEKNICQYGQVQEVILKTFYDQPLFWSKTPKFNPETLAWGKCDPTREFLFATPQQLAPIPCSFD